MIIKDWPIDLFIKFYPEYKDLMLLFISDPEYIVRTKFNDQGRIIDIEVGYKNDDWVLPEPKDEIKD